MAELNNEFQIPPVLYSPEFFAIHEEIEIAYQPTERQFSDEANKQSIQARKDVDYLYELSGDEYLYLGRLRFITDGLDEVRKSHLSMQDSKPQDDGFARILISKLLKDALPISQPKQVTEGTLIDKESFIGGAIFGDSQDKLRKFFNYGNSWFFHEELVASGESVTIHYEVHKNVVTKSISNQPGKWTLLEGEELRSFIAATEIYYERVLAQLYGRECLDAKSQKLEEIMALIDDSQSEDYSDKKAA